MTRHWVSLKDYNFPKWGGTLQKRKVAKKGTPADCLVEAWFIKNDPALRMQCRIFEDGEKKKINIGAVEPCRYRLSQIESNNENWICHMHCTHIVSSDTSITYISWPTWPIHQKTHNRKQMSPISPSRRVSRGISYLCQYSLRNRRSSKTRLQQSTD